MLINVCFFVGIPVCVLGMLCKAMALTHKGHVSVQTSPLCELSIEFSVLVDTCDQVLLPGLCGERQDGLASVAVQEDEQLGRT